MPSDDSPAHFPQTLNTYGHVLELLRNQLLWDLNPEAWRSRRRLRTLKDRHRGETAVIVCNGPSLLRSRLEILKGTFTFGLNKINLIFDQNDFRPSCIVSVNPYVLEQNAAFFAKTGIPLFLDKAGLRFVGSGRNVTYLNSVNIRRFPKSCTMGIYQGYTVTSVALQLAFHMGFARVALIGCDHRFKIQGVENQLVDARAEDRDHFSPNYFHGDMKWQLPDLRESEISYRTAYRAYTAHGRQLMNATVGGNLEILPRCSLEEFLDGDNHP